MRRKPSLCCRECRPVSVRLSVCHLRVYCIHMADVIVELLSRPGSPIILVVLTPSAYTILRGNGKIGDFRLKSPFISEMVRDRLMHGCYGTLK